MDDNVKIMVVCLDCSYQWPASGINEPCPNCGSLDVVGDEAAADIEDDVNMLGIPAMILSYGPAFIELT